MELRDRATSGIADGADPRPQRAQILPRLVQPLHKITHSVHACENQPVIAAQLGDGAIERPVIRRRDDLDGRHLNHIRAQRPQGSAKHLGLIARACDDDTQSEQRQPLEPIQLLA